MPPEQGIWLNDDEGLFPCPNEPCQQDEEHAIGPGDKCRFTCRLRMMSCCRGRAFSARSSDLLRPESARVESGKEEAGGLVQRAKREERASKHPRDAQRGCETRERCKSRVAATGRYHSSPPDTSGRDARAPGKARF